MTNTSLLIIAILLAVILFQMVINIGIADSNVKLNELLDELDNELNVQSDIIKSQISEIDFLSRIERENRNV